MHPPGVRRTIRRRIMIFLSVLLGAIALLASIPVVFQNRLIYFPRRYDAALKPGLGTLSAFRKYRTADGLEQWGFFIPPANEADGAKGASPRFYLVFYGNASTAMELSSEFETLAKRTGCGFFIADYRGYGFNPGTPTERGLVADAIGAYDTLEKEGLFRDGVGVIGHSLGGGAAFALAVQRPVERVITLSTFTSVDAMIRHTVFWPLSPFSRNHWPNDQRLRELLQRPADKRPAEFLLFHARGDGTIPFSMGEALAETPGEGVRFIPVPNANHGNVLDVALETLGQELSVGAGRGAEESSHGVRGLH